jgi:hypothetical protein
MFITNLATTICAQRQVIGLGANLNSPKTLMAHSQFTQLIKLIRLNVKAGIYLSKAF